MTQQDEDEDRRTYAVVVNHEEQYSIWLTDRPPPAGWREVGVRGLKAECLEHIKQVWTDLRPLSLRKKLEEWEKNRPPFEDLPDEPLDPVDDLVRRLSEPQPVEAGVRPERRLRYFRDALGRDYVHMKFVRTGTELGIRLDRERCDLSGADFESESGSIRLEGTLTLNYNRVRYEGTLDLATLEGTGKLTFIETVRPGSGD